MLGSVLGRPARLLEVVPRDADDALIGGGAGRRAGRRVGAAPVDALGAVLAAGLHAAAAMATTPASAAIRRLIMDELLLKVSLVRTRRPR